MIHPVDEQLLFGAAFLDALSAGVLYPVRRLIQQQGSLRVGPVHQIDQRIPERLDDLRGGAFGGKPQARPRGDTFGMMARLAPGVIENGIKACGERRSSRVRRSGKHKEYQRPLSAGGVGSQPHHSNLPPNRIERTPLAPVITPTDPRLVIVVSGLFQLGWFSTPVPVISTRNVNLS